MPDDSWKLGAIHKADMIIGSDFGQVLRMDRIDGMRVFGLCWRSALKSMRSA